MNTRGKWLASLGSGTARYYEEIFDNFWGWAASRYSPSRGVEPLDWLAEHRRAELKDPKTRLHCEGLVAEWYESLKESDLDPSSRDTYLAVVRSFFNHLLPRDAGSLR